MNLPLDILISNKAAFLKRRNETIEAPGETKHSTDIDILESSSLFRVDEYEFPHVVAMNDSVLKAEPLIAAYRHCYDFLKLSEKRGNYI